MPPGGFGPPPGGFGPPPGGFGGGFLPPAGGGGLPPGAGAPPGSISASDPWSFAWKLITKRFAEVALPLAVAFFVQAFLGNLVSLGGGFVVGVLQAQDLLEDSVLVIANLAVNIVGGTASLLVSSYMTGGIVLTALKAVRGERVAFGDPFSGGRFFGPMLVAAIAGSIVILIGYVLCIVPGVIVALGVCLYPYLIVDQTMPGVDALKRSWEMTKGHKMTIFLVGLIGIFVFIAGALACGIGLVLVSLPMAMLGAAYLYLRIKGEAIPEPA
jgi:uncharacterized membrane protein